MFASCEFMDKGKCRYSVSLDWNTSLQAYLFWFLLFMKTRGSMAPIGALDYRRMRSCGNMKDGSFAIKGLLLVFGENKKKTKYSNVGLCLQRMIELTLFEMHREKNALHV
jgi:hypothetical protein